MAVTATQKNGDVLVVNFTEGKILDETVIAQVGTELMAALDKAADNQVLVNFAGVKFLSSSALGKLVLMNKKAKAEKMALKFCAIRPEIMEVFKITGLDKIFDIQPDELSAMAAFAKKKWLLS